MEMEWVSSLLDFNLFDEHIYFFLVSSIMELKWREREIAFGFFF